MRRLGANVWPLNTVQFSNHTQYGKWTGCVMPPSHLTEIVQGIAAIDNKYRNDIIGFSALNYSYNRTFPTSLISIY